MLDPFLGSGTVAAVARSLGRRAIGIELNPAYLTLARKRLAETQPPLPFHPVPVPAGMPTGEEPAGA